MRIVVDAMCSEYGGIATYVTNLLRSWPTQFPDDEVHVLAPTGVALPDEGITVHPMAVHRPVALFRPLVQTRAVRALARQVDADAVLATLPATTLLHPRRPMVVVVYDLRHELRPQQFSLTRRALRRVSYGRGYALADGFVAISRRSLDDLHALHPRTMRVPGAVAHLAADQVADWRREPSEPYALAFGHHTNKNTGLVLEAWGRLKQGHAMPSRGLPKLKIIGLSADERRRVTAVLQERRLSDVVEVAPFLAAGQFESVMASASLVVFPSDFEGFGLPVLEAMRLGVPVVVGPDRAVLEIAGGHASVMNGWSPDDLVDAVIRASATSAQERAAAAEHAATFTWAATAHRTREALVLAAATKGDG